MEVTSIGSNYNVYESTYASQKNNTAKNVETNESPATCAESTKYSASSKVSEYSSYLTKNYDCVRSGNVAIAGSYLRQCASDPEKAKELEENLSLYNKLYDESYKGSIADAQKLGGKLVAFSQSWNIDSKGGVSMTTSVTVEVESGTKSQKEIKEEQEERLREKQEQKRIAEKKEREKQQQERRENDNDIEASLSTLSYKKIDISI